MSFRHRREVRLPCCNQDFEPRDRHILQPRRGGGGGQGYGVLGVAGDMTFRRALERTEALLRVLRA